MAYLALVRHGQSEWNAHGLWTGKTDVLLTDKGRIEARNAGLALKDINFQVAYTSTLKRAMQTLDEIKNILILPNIPIRINKALDERDYGEYTGKNKWQVKESVGGEEFTRIRRSWDYPLPGGESLKDVYLRIVPYYKEHILKDLISGKNVVISAHGNSIRALIKYLENISDKEIPNLEIATGEVYVYEVNSAGGIVSKQIRAANTDKGNQ